MDERRKRVGRVTVQQDIQLDQFRRPVTLYVIIE